jgi:drug/metabolite transporter (DMT)-like permease
MTNKFSHLQALLAVLIWGASFPVLKHGLSQISPLAYSALSMLIAGLILVCILACRRELKPVKVSLKPLINTVFAQTIFQGFLVLGLKNTSASNSAILLATSPLLVYIYTSFVLKKLPGKLQIIGVLLGFLGVCLVIGINFNQTLAAGDLLALGSAASWAWYCLATKPLVDEVGALKAVTLAVTISALLFLVFSMPQILALRSQPVSLGAWASLLYNATLVLVVGMFFWNQALDQLGAKVAMLYTYLEPVFAVAVAFVLLKEAVLLRQVLGGLLVLAAVWLSSREGGKNE